MITAGGDPSLLERFKSEARSTGSLQCPNIVTVYDFGEQDGNPYLVMQYLEGSSLESMIQKGVSLSLSEKLGIIIDVCNGLAYAHQRGVIHRDIKPANIMVLHDGVNDGLAVIVDFGIARIGGDTRLTRTDQIVGSIHYMSAEQLQAKELDNRTDVYATGVVLFQLLTGALPFDSPDTAATLLKIINEPPPPLSTYLKEYPVELDEIVSRALAKKREERYASAKDLVFDLTQVQDHLKSETVAQLLRRAETSLKREEFTRAREHLQQAQRIDRQNTTVQKMLSAVQERLRQLQQIEQARALRGQADEAYLDQRYDDALRLLEQAVALDGNNSDLQVFRDSVRSAKERAIGLRRALRRAEAALQDGDLDEAQNAVSEAFKIDPQDTQAESLKVVIAQQSDEKLRHEKVKKLLDEARNQITSRNLTAAFNILKNVETLDPTSNELQTLVKLAIAAREQEKRRAETEALRRQIEAALREEDFATAVARADEGLLKFPQEQSLLKLKALADAQRLRVERKTFVREQFSAANSLADSGQLRQAVALLERALQRAPGNSELESLQATFLDRLATEEAAQRRRQAVETTLAEGERILRESGARDATRYLDTQAAEYSDSQPFRQLHDSVREREALETLDTRLANEPNPAMQLQVGEEVLRQNPNNHGIQQRVANLRLVRDQINAVIKQAQGFESAGRFPEAMQQWQRLAKSYPQVSEFKAQIRRIATLLESRKNTAPAAVQLHELDKSRGSLSATRVLDSAVPPSVEPSRDVTFSEATRPPVAQPKKIATPRDRIAPSTKPPQPTFDSANLLFSRPKKYILLASAVIVLAVVGYLIFAAGEKTVSVQVTTNPVQADVTIGTQKCHAPCGLSLRPGTYELRAERDGYKQVTRQVSIAPDTKSLPVIELTQIAEPPKDQGTLIVRANVYEADVFVGKNLIGATGADGKFEGPLTVGAYEITVKKPGYEEQPSRPVEITKNQTYPLDFVLNPTSEPSAKTPGSSTPSTKSGRNTQPEQHLIIEGLPSDAEVLIDSHAYQRPASRELDVLVQAGLRHIEVNAKGFELWRKDVKVESGERKTVKAAMKSIVPLVPPSESSSPATASPAVPSPSGSFEVNRKAIDKGETALLRWNIQNARDVSLDGQTVNSSGSKPVTPNESTTYRLVATGPGGGHDFEVSLIVNPPAALKVPTEIVNAPAALKAPTETLAIKERDKKEIADLLAQYAASFEHRDAKKLQELWPGIGKDILKKVKASYRLNTKVSFSNLSFSPLSDGLVRVSCTQSVQSDQSVSSKANFSILVKQKADNWVINYVPLND
jgi:serine/threonine-protein kinase